MWPNSGDVLKLLVPSCSRKATSGSINHWCTVTSHKIIERAMDYRGSKSTVRVRKLYTVVKEQRVDGHRCINLMHLRYALMGFERNYQIRILSKQLIMPSLRRSYTSLSVNPNLKSTATGTLNPLFLTGFSDAESNFTVRIFKSNTVKVGWCVQPVFQIELHKKDLNVLEKISSFLGVGKIYHKEESSIYMVQSLRDIDVIINHFEKYPLLTKKLEDFQLFSQIVTLIHKKEHLTITGWHKIISLRASMNKGLSTFMKTTFPDIIPATRPSRSDEELINSKIDPYWMAGFVAGEGCFSIRITKSLTLKTGYQVQLRFNVTQHSIDKVFMNSLVAFWGCGKVFLRFRENKVDFQILKLKDLTDKVIPLFQSISLQGVKSKDFADFCKAVDIMKVKGHLTNEGLDQIRRLKAGMNRGRE
uniref:LAGLIDADG endonuclease n=4 Tax=Fusarium sambucinum species complex TaxID=569360 RepID=A0A6G6B333_FUSCU|nr:LAGLIDADG endonuclease [Fusarium pseudograminearum]YP_010390907.1 LAGLIDADG endonuclease [Fusarium louisianense]YP_010391118.1 LAGLIDADG endonuclease [Fusarium ussurianum]YP_010391175.1 LAGLIDADG endonuclease [Fusarium vorosii]AYN73101.1 LAGLIDADG endonuclease [Fusarium graminearum]QID42285.1 LAGLIDADG endonuclease [Fusarium culmorum]UPX01858.1 LAGLIDADG endonuclease [Fusarium gerlachii]DAC73461.1 TPA_asm: LAGLIDADG endonuclease [Fusarium graminearum CS3005]QID41609.1 LAGLIDADG endonucle